MQKTEVTVDEYAACVSAGGCTAARDPYDREWNQRPESQLCNAGIAGRGKHPINCVYFNQALGYCQWRGGRLPTNDEWEYAARGTDGRTYPWGNQPPRATLLNACGDECVANYKTKSGSTEPGMYPGDDGFPETAPVGSFPAGASPFGVLDMVGNVMEWTAEPVYYDCTVLNCATAFARFMRGCSFSADDVSEARVAWRFGPSPPRMRSAHLGFRCMR